MAEQLNVGQWDYDSEESASIFQTFPNAWICQCGAANLAHHQGVNEINQVTHCWRDNKPRLPPWNPEADDPADTSGR